MTRTVLCVAVLLFALLSTGGGVYAQQRSEIVYLDQSRNWMVSPVLWASVRPLSRELVRQAVLLAARDELGLVTRDAWLGDSMPKEGDNAPCDVVAAMREPLVVELVRGFAPHQSAFSQHELVPPIRKTYTVDYGKLAELEEVHSRTTFVEGLKKAGFDGKPNRRDESIAVPEPIEQSLGEMSLLSQFRALRELHALMRDQGESAAVLGALSRAYANLGVMTEYYWHPAHKVFKARSLLYAQRILARDENAPIARWHRAYAAALTGLHRSALDDLEAAENAWQAIPEAKRPPRPAWALLIGPLCHYQVDILGEHAKDEKIGPLAAMLRFLAVDQAGGQAWSVQTALEAIIVIPECDRVLDRLCDWGLTPALRPGVTAPATFVGEAFYNRIEEMPGLPDEIHSIVKEQTNAGENESTKLAEMQRPDSADEAVEFSIRGRLIDALLKSGDSAAGKADNAAKERAGPDRGEPSWAALGLLLREMSFMQLYRRTFIEQAFSDVPTEELLTRAAPLVRNHPFKAFLGTLASEYDNRRKAEADMAKVDLTGLEYNAEALQAAFYENESMRLKLRDENQRNADYVTGDFVTMLRSWARGRTKTSAVWLARLMPGISPDSPLARGVLIDYDWDKIQPDIAAWEKAAAPYPALCLSLGKKYIELGRLEDAERCLEAAIKVTPGDEACYRQLGLVHKLRGEDDRWIGTLERCLHQPDYRRTHAGVKSEIAEYYMWQKQWEKALPYAEEAAETHSLVGLLSAAQCNEGLQRWAKAEEQYRECSQRFRGSSLHWYFFCRRTGEGDLQRARQLAYDYIKNRGNTTGWDNLYEVVAFYLLEEQLGQAQSSLERATKHSENPMFSFTQAVGHGEDRYDEIWLALVADQAQDVKSRDAALSRVRMRNVKANTEPVYRPTGLAALVALVQKDLASGGKGRINLAAAENCSMSLPDSDRFAFYYLFAQYLSLHGQRDAADRYWKHCMGRPDMTAPLRTLAGAMLLEDGIGPADYAPLLKPDTEGGEESKVEEQTPKKSPGGKEQDEGNENMKQKVEVENEQ